jgi:hypothetical protein
MSMSMFTFTFTFTFMFMFTFMTMIMNVFMFMFMDMDTDKDRDTDTDGDTVMDGVTDSDRLASLVAGRRPQCTPPYVPMQWNIKSAPASPGTRRVGPALYIFRLLGREHYEKKIDGLCKIWSAT